MREVKILKKLLEHHPAVNGCGIPEKFLLQFVLFKVLVRLVGRYYRAHNAQKKKSDAHISLDISVVKRSLLHFRIPVADERLELLLDSKLTKRNTKSARNLRNGLAHQ